MGPWLHAPKRGRRRTIKEPLTEGRSNHGKIAISSGESRFGILADLGSWQIWEIREMIWKLLILRRFRRMRGGTNRGKFP